MGKTKSLVSVKIKKRYHGNNSKGLLGALKDLREVKRFDILNKYGQLGVEALRAATPVDSGVTANSWSYDIVISDIDNDRYRINWRNNNIVDGWANIALLLQMGHGTGTGGWIEGRDYINPAIQPVLDALAEECWSEVIKL